LAVDVFRRRGDGSVVVTLDADTFEVLRSTAREVAAIVAEPPDQEVSDRLFPRAYLDPTEEQAEQELRDLTHSDLVQTRLTALEAVTDDLEIREVGRRGRVEIVLAPGQEQLWLTALNDARLVFGTLLGVTQDEQADYKATDPRYEYGVVYRFLSALQQELVELLLGEMPPGADEEF
jgi:hypothetical protein